MSERVLSLDKKMSHGGPPGPRHRREVASELFIGSLRNMPALFEADLLETLPTCPQLEDEVWIGFRSLSEIVSISVEDIVVLKHFVPTTRGAGHPLLCEVSDAIARYGIVAADVETEFSRTTLLVKYGNAIAVFAHNRDIPSDVDVAGSRNRDLTTIHPRLLAKGSIPIECGDVVLNRSLAANLIKNAAALVVHRDIPLENYT